MKLAIKALEELIEEEAEIQKPRISHGHFDEPQNNYNPEYVADLAEAVRVLKLLEKQNLLFNKQTPNISATPTPKAIFKKSPKCPKQIT